MNKQTLVSLLLGSMIAALVVGCAQNVSPNTYEASHAGVASKVEPGVVIAKREVNIDANSGAGGLAGATAGGVAASTLGGSPSGSVVAAVGGAVVGGLLGNTMDKAVNSHKGYEYIIKLKKGSTISVTQAQNLQFSIHQRVLVIYGPVTRIIADETV